MAISVADDVSLDGQFAIEFDALETFVDQDEIVVLDIGGDRFGNFDNFVEGQLVARINQFDVMFTYAAGDGNDVGVRFVETFQVLGDTNNDLIVNGEDLANVRDYFGTGNIRGDADHDGGTDLGDLFAVRNETVMAVAAIPEPSGLLVLMGASLLAWRRR